jgi:hypothetical protein
MDNPMKNTLRIVAIALCLALAGRAPAQTFSNIQFGGDICTSSKWNTQSVCKIDGTSVPVNSAADQTIITTASATGAWKSFPACTDTSGNHLNYDTSTHSFSCGTSVPSSGGGSGSVTSVNASAGGIYSFSGGPITASGTLALAVAGTSGGIPYFSSASALSSSGVMTANELILGGGAGGTPTVVSGLGTSTQVLHGNASGAPSWSAIAGADLPNPSASTLGGVESLAVVSHKWINTISTAGVPAATQPACGDLSDSAAMCSSTDSANLTGTLAAARLPSNTKIRSFGTTFGDTAATSALTSGSIVYFTIPYSCTISAWNITVDAGTVTFDILKVATGSAIPTSSITASALPALSTGTALHSTTLTSWTTSVAANDIVGIKLQTVATAKYAELDVECDQ